MTGHPAVVTGCGEECKEAWAKVHRGPVRVRGTDGGALSGRGGYHDMPHHNHHNNGGGRGYRQQSGHDQNNHRHNNQGGRGDLYFVYSVKTVLCLSLLCTPNSWLIQRTVGNNGVNIKKWFGFLLEYYTLSSASP